MKDNNETNEKEAKQEKQVKKEKAFEGDGAKTDKKEQKGKKKKLNSEKRFYLFTAISCAAILLIIIVVAVMVGGSGAGGNSALLPPVGGNSSSDGGNGETEEPVITLPEGMISPLAVVTVGNDYGFHQSGTLGWYYVHEGVDFAAEVGTEVLAAEDGVVESVYKDDLLLGTEIVLSHGDGLKTLYRFVSEADGLTVGKTVKKGEVIATVAEATGNEYKDGAHLHFEVLEYGKSVDPSKYLTLEEK